MGYPNAGKSTLISRWSAARPKIADYPFTTLVPNLGVVRGKSLDFVLADVPGIIEGAHEGKGLGHRFLKHAERSRLLIILLDLDPNTGRQLDDEYHVLMRELREFSEELSHRPRFVVVNKSDAFGTDAQDELFKEFLLERGYGRLEAELKKNAEKIYLISGVSGAGLEALRQVVEEYLRSVGPRVFVNELTSRVSFGDSEMLGFRKRHTDDENVDSETEWEEEALLDEGELDDDTEEDSK